MINRTKLMDGEFITNVLKEVKSYIPENDYTLNYCVIIWRNPLTGILEKRFIISTVDEVIDWKDKNKENYKNIEHSIYINGSLSY